nr:F47 [uncultured bacterium]
MRNYFQYCVLDASVDMNLTARDPMWISIEATLILRKEIT